MTSFTNQNSHARVLVNVPGELVAVVLAGIRVHDEVERCPQRVKCLEVGDWLEAECCGSV